MWFGCLGCLPRSLSIELLRAASPSHIDTATATAAISTCTAAGAIFIRTMVIKSSGLKNGQCSCFETLKHTTCRHMVFDAAAAIASQHCNRSDRYNNIGPRNVLARSWSAIDPDAGWESMRNRFGEAVCNCTSQEHGLLPSLAVQNAEMSVVTSNLDCYDGRCMEK